MAWLTINAVIVPDNPAGEKEAEKSYAEHDARDHIIIG